MQKHKAVHQHPSQNSQILTQNQLKIHKFTYKDNNHTLFKLLKFT